jgi:hypothetical protein
MFLADDAVRFDPRSREDVIAAEQESKIVNWLFRKMNGFMIFYWWFKDTMLAKNAYVKVWWEDKNKTDVEEFTGLTEDELAALVVGWTAEGKEVEFIESDSEIRDINGQEVEIFDAKIRVTTKDGQFDAEPIPPEDMLVTPRPFRNIRDCSYIGHKARRTRSDLIESGFPKATVNRLPAFTDELRDAQTHRNTLTEEDSTNRTDKAMEEVEVYEEYVRIDFNNDGVAELRKVIRTHDKILLNEETDLIPFAYLTTTPMPHRHMGLSFHDLLKDIVDIKTTLWRQLIDNTVNANNPGHIVDANRVNVPDLLVDTPRRIIRANGDVNNAILPLPVENITNRILPVISYTDSVAERRVGGSGAQLAVDPSILKQSTAGAFEEGLSAANQRIEAIGRIFAETGVSDFFILLHTLLVKHQDFRISKEINGEWVDIDPRTWDKRESLEVNVGLGTSSNREMRENLLLIKQVQDASPGFVTPADQYNLAVDLVKNLGFKAPDKYFTNPDDIPPAPPEENPLITVEKLKGEAREKSDQLRAQADFIDKQIEQQEKDKDRALKEKEVQIRAVDVQSQVRQRDVENEATQAEAELKRVEASDAFREAERLVNES